MKKIVTLLAIGVSTLCFASHTVYDLIDYGLENSLEINRSAVEQQNSKASLNNSYWDLLPAASISASRFQTNTLDAVPDSSSAVSNSESASLSLSKSITLNDPNYYSIRTNKIAEKNSELSYLNIRKQLATVIFSKYVSVVQSQENLKTAEKNLEIQQRIYRISEMNYENGNISSYDKQNSELNLLNQEIQVEEYQNNLDELRHNLFSYINLTDDEQELLTPDIIMEIPTITNYENNQLKITKNNLKSQKLSLFQQKLNLFPIPAFTASYSYDNSYDIFDNDLYEDFLSFGVSVSYNIFNIPNLRNNYLNSKRNFKLSKLALDIEEKDNRAAIDLALLKLEALQKSFNLYERKLTLAEDNFSKAEKQFELGLINLTELETSRVQLFNAHISKNSKYYQFIQKQEDLKFLISDKILGKY